MSSQESDSKTHGHTDGSSNDQDSSSSSQRSTGPHHEVSTATSTSLAGSSSSSSFLVFRICANVFRFFSIPTQLFCVTLFRVLKRIWPGLAFTLGPYSTDPLDNVTSFIEDFERKYGNEHPTFYRGSYPQALSEAKKELRFLLVYLHNESHEDTQDFCQTVLIHKEVTNYINRNNLIFWACSIDSPEGYRVSQALRENTYPFLALVVLKNNHMTVVRKFEGQTSVERLLSQLQQSIEDNEGSIVSSRLERQARDMNQQIRQQQDQDYLESLRADQEKERRRRAERERLELEQNELRRRKQQEQDEAERLEKLRVTIGENLAPEPKAGSAEAIRLRVNLPNGRKVQRLFNRDQSIKHLFEFVFSQPDCPKRFKLKTNFPVRELPSTYPTLEKPDCRSTTDEKQLPITFSEFGIVKDELVYLYDLDA